MPQYNKPFRTLAQQVALLSSRGMDISDIPKAEQCLGKIGYYRLSAYWYPFRESAPNAISTLPPVILDTFKSQTYLSNVVDLYVFDKKLRLIVLDALERIEICFRTDLALLLGRRNPKAHRDIRYFNRNFGNTSRKNSPLTLHQDWLRRVDEKCNSSREDFAKHFKQKYPNDDMPIWISTELWDFGALAHLFSGLKDKDKHAIATAYGIPNAPTRLNGFVLESWLRCFNDIRNLCAHHSRMWNRPLVNPPHLGTIPEFLHISGSKPSQTRLYAALLAIQYLLKTINPDTCWRDRLKEHVINFPTSLHTQIANAGFPDDWETEVIWN